MEFTIFFIIYAVLFVGIVFVSELLALIVKKLFGKRGEVIFRVGAVFLALVYLSAKAASE